MNNERLLAAKILKSVIENKTPLPLAIKQCKTNTPWIQNICYSSARFWYELSFIVNKFLQKPIRKKDNIVFYLLIIGICQIRILKTPHHIAVDSCVKAGKKTKLPWAGSLINAVLQNYIKNESDISIKNIEAQLNHPAWLIKHIKKEYKEHANTIFAANNSHPPYTLKINLLRTSCREYEMLLKENNIEFQYNDNAPPGAFIIKQSIPAEKLPGFEDGLFFVQDTSPQLAASLLDLEPGQKVLDACAAPGGKTALIFTNNPKTEITAVDIQEDRIAKLQSNLERLGISKNISIKQADLCSLEQTNSLGSFDRILIDAPCSATGIIRRQPDIKLIKDYDDVVKISKTSAIILENTWEHLKPGGKLLYATCSIMPIENQNQIDAFLKKHTNAALVNIVSSIPNAFDTGFGAQILPEVNLGDGFFYSLLEKVK